MISGDPSPSRSASAGGSKAKPSTAKTRFGAGSAALRVGRPPASVATEPRQLVSLHSLQATAVAPSPRSSTGENATARGFPATSAARSSASSISTVVERAASAATSSGTIGTSATRNASPPMRSAQPVGVDLAEQPFDPRQMLLVVAAEVVDQRLQRELAVALEAAGATELGLAEAGDHRDRLRPRGADGGEDLVWVGLRVAARAG